MTFYEKMHQYNATFERKQSERADKFQMKIDELTRKHKEKHDMRWNKAHELTGNAFNRAMRAIRNADDKFEAKIQKLTDAFNAKEAQYEIAFQAKQNERERMHFEKENLKAAKADAHKLLKKRNQFWRKFKAAKWDAIRENRSKMILGCIYQYAEETGKCEFSLKELGSWADAKAGTPYEVFGVYGDELRKVVNGASVNYSDLIRVSFTLDMDSIAINANKTAKQAMETLRKAA